MFNLLLKFEIKQMNVFIRLIRLIEIFMFYLMLMFYLAYKPELKNYE